MFNKISTNIKHILDIIAHVHLITNLKFTFHHKNNKNKTKCTNHHSKKKLCCSGTANTIVWKFGLDSNFRTGKWIDRLLIFQMLLTSHSLVIFSFILLVKFDHLLSLRSQFRSKHSGRKGWQKNVSIMVLCMITQLHPLYNEVIGFVAADQSQAN